MAMQGKSFLLVLPLARRQRFGAEGPFEVAGCLDRAGVPQFKPEMEPFRRVPARQSSFVLPSLFYSASPFNH